MPPCNATSLPGRQRHGVDRAHAHHAAGVSLGPWISARFAIGVETADGFAFSRAVQGDVTAPRGRLAGHACRAPTRRFTVTAAMRGRMRSTQEAGSRESLRRQAQGYRVMRRLREGAFHFAAQPHGLRRRIELDIVPAHGRARGDVALELHLVREADRQARGAQRIARGMSLPHTV